MKKSTTICDKCNEREGEEKPKTIVDYILSMVLIVFFVAGAALLIRFTTPEPEKKCLEWKMKPEYIQVMPDGRKYQVSGVDYCLKYEE